jgi:hypothetical protein
MTRSTLVLAAAVVLVGCGAAAPPSPPPPRSAASAPASRPAPAAVGYLRINAHPWCRISVDGRDTGMTTPQLRMELPVGRHTIGLGNPSFDTRAEIVVDIRAGRLLTKIVDLRPPAGPVVTWDTDAPAAAPPAAP